MKQQEITIQIGGFRVLSEFLPDGQISNVYIVEGDQGDRFALKRLKPMWNNFESLRDEFTDEASRLIELDFPSLIRGVKLGFEEDIPFFTMELATETLQDSLRRQCCLPTEEALRILESVASAIDFLHEKGLAHQDVKPSNIFRFFSVDGNWVTKLGDLGLTRNFEFTLTRAGSAPYAAVEVLDGRTANYPPEIRARADVYSLAVIAAELLTGAYVSFHFRAPGAWVADLPETVAKVLLQGMDHEPAARHATALGFVSELRLALEANLLTARNERQYGSFAQNEIQEMSGERDVL